MISKCFKIVKMGSLFSISAISQIKKNCFKFCCTCLLNKAQIEELQEKQEMEKNAQIQRTEELEQQCAEKKERVNADQRKLQEMKRQVAQHAINSRSGKPIPEKVRKASNSHQKYIQWQYEKYLSIWTTFIKIYHEIKSYI